MTILRLGAIALSACLLALSTFAARADDAASAALPRSDDERALSEAQLLGKRLFEDANLSEPRGLSCQSCHVPAHAFQGTNGSPIPGIAAGSTPDKLGTRKTPTIMYKTYSPAFGFYKDIDDGKETLEAKGGQFWDGRASDMAEQATSPMLNPVEMNNPSIEAVVAKVKAGAYADLVTKVYGADAFADPKAAMAKLTAAIFAFEATERFAPFSSKFDDVLRGKAKFTAEEARGFELFTDPKRGNCIACHVGKRLEGPDRLDLHRLHLRRDRRAAEPEDPRQRRPRDLRPRTLQAAGPRGQAAEGDRARIAVRRLQGPDVAQRRRRPAPIYHNAAFANPARRGRLLRHPRHRAAALVSETFDRRGRQVERPAWRRQGERQHEGGSLRPPSGQRPRLSDRDVDALVAFLNTLTDKGMQ